MTVTVCLISGQRWSAWSTLLIFEHHRYLQVGNYSLKVTVTDGNGGSVANQQVNVEQKYDLLSLASVYELPTEGEFSVI